MIAIPDTEEIKKADGIGLNIHYEDGHIETYIIGIDEIIEIVTCGECKHWNEETHGCNRNPSVGAWWETDFCSYGERRTDDLDRVPNDEG